jgi:hypothetical protein
MDFSTIESLWPFGVAIFSIVSAWYAMKMSAAKNATAIKSLTERVENLAKQIAALWQKKDASIETEVEVKYLRRDVDELRKK